MLKSESGRKFSAIFKFSDAKDSCLVIILGIFSFKIPKLMARPYPPYGLEEMFHPGIDYWTF